MKKTIITVIGLAIATTTLAIDHNPQHLKQRVDTSNNDIWETAHVRAYSDKDRVIHVDTNSKVSFTDLLIWADKNKDKSSYNSQDTSNYLLTTSDNKIQQLKWSLGPREYQRVYYHSKFTIKDDKGYPQTVLCVSKKPVALKYVDIWDDQGKYITDTYIKPSTYYTEDSSFLGTRIPLDCTTKQEYDLYDSGVQQGNCIKKSLQI